MHFYLVECVILITDCVHEIDKLNVYFIFKQDLGVLNILENEISNDFHTNPYVHCFINLQQQMFD